MINQKVIFLERSSELNHLCPLDEALRSDDNVYMMVGLILFALCILYPSSIKACTPIFPNGGASIQLNGNTGCYWLTGQGTATVGHDTSVVASNITDAMPIVDLQSSVYTVDVIQKSTLRFSSVLLLNALLFSPDSTPFGWLAAIGTGGSLVIQNCVVQTTCSALNAWNATMDSDATTVNSTSFFVGSYNTGNTSLLSTYIVCDPLAPQPSASSSVSSETQLSGVISGMDSLGLPSLIEFYSGLSFSSSWSAPAMTMPRMQLYGRPQSIQEQPVPLDLGSQPALFTLAGTSKPGPSLALDNLVVFNGCVQAGVASSDVSPATQASQMVALMTPMGAVTYNNG